MAITVETHDRLDDAARALASDQNARFHGGGTLVMRTVNEGDEPFSKLVLTRDPAFREIRSSGGSVVLGAGVTMSAILANRELSFLHPVARSVGGPAIRSAATVGGNLFAEAPYGDFTTALLALGASVEIAGSGGQSSIDDWLRDRGRNRNRLVRAVSLDRVSDDRSFRFRKISRVKPKGVSILSIAAYLPGSGSRITGARIAFGNMAEKPVRSSGAERALDGQSINEQVAEAAAAAALDGLNPVSDAIASEWYRREVAGVHLKRLLIEG